MLPGTAIAVELEATVVVLDVNEAATLPMPL